MKILYLSHVSWHWTKQRPQFIAEELSKNFDVTYVQKRGFQSATTYNKQSVTVKVLFRLPLARFKVVRFLNNVLFKIQLLLDCLRADVIWFTSPEMYSCVPCFFFKKKITVYDCMDDMVELYPLLKEMESLEKKLYSKSKIVLASSLHLAEKLKAKYGERIVKIVNNAISSSFEQKGIELPDEIVHLVKEDTFKITYVGSISSWMDFNLLKAIHEKFPQIKIMLWGPIDVEIPKDSGVTCCGVVEHKYVSSILSSSNILIMPFIVNDLIKSVNPVKLYEYIYTGKPCIAPKYGESLQFEEYVNLYENEEQCISIIERVLAGETLCQSKEKCEAYIACNTWCSRIKDILNLLTSLNC